ncbi:MAG: DinB family protein [Rhodothermales bacterium]
MDTESELTLRLKDVLTWHSAHVDLERAVRGVPPDHRGRRPDGCPHSLWQLLEHIRLAQADILKYCTSDVYEPPTWPDDYWPLDPHPPTAEAWQQSVQALLADRAGLIELIEEVDVEDHLLHAPEHTYLRETLLVADHTAYHVGQIVLLRRILGIWPA